MSSSFDTSLLGLPPTPRQPPIHNLNPRQPPPHNFILPHPIHLHLDHTPNTQRNLDNLPPTTRRPPHPILPIPSIPVTQIIFPKQRLHRRPTTNRPAPAEQTPVARAVPETPAKGHGLVAAVDELPAYLADGEVDERGVACRAGEAGVAAEELGGSCGEVEAECAGEDGASRGGRHRVLCGRREGI